MKQTKWFLAIIIAYLFCPKIGLAESRKTIEFYRHPIESRTSTFLGDNPGYVPVSEPLRQRGFGGKFCMAWPTHYGVDMGFSIGAGRALTLDTTSVDSNNNLYSERIHASYWRTLFEAEKRKYVKFIVFSIKGGAGYLGGRASRNVSDTRLFVPLVSFGDFTETKSWNGFTAEIIPSVGFALGRAELKVGAGWRYFPRVPWVSGTHVFSSNNWTNTISFSW